MNQNFQVISLRHDDAVKMAQWLGGYGIKAAVSAIDSALPVAVSAVCVSEEDALRTLDLLHSLGTGLALRQMAGNRGNSGGILIPVDMTEKSFTACEVGFELAQRLSEPATVMYSYLPIRDLKLTKGEYVAPSAVRTRAESELSRFVHDVKLRQGDGRLLPVEFGSRLASGVPEDAILETARLTKPKIIVMATRNRHKKAEELIGSVTAEVLDGCRVPLFTVPEDYHCPGIRNITRLVYFCYLEKDDAAALERFLNIFDYPDVHITLLPVVDRVGERVVNALARLQTQLEERYPNSRFDTLTLTKSTFRDDFKNFIENEGIELLVVQNKKKNVFSRLINPGIAHVLLYERDMPMIILPV